MITNQQEANEHDTEQLAARVAERLIKRQPLLEDHDGEHFNIEVFAGADGASFDYFGQQFISLINHGRRIEIKRTADDIWLDDQTVNLMDLILKALTGSKLFGISSDFIVHEKRGEYVLAPNQVFAFTKGVNF